MVKRSDLPGHAGYSYCASHSRFSWGFKLYPVCAGDGMPIMWCLAGPRRTGTGQRPRMKAGSFGVERSGS